MSESKKGELAIRDKALQHQQRRLKQATQFTHKDSADLLPLDGLKRLGTSKDLVSERMAFKMSLHCLLVQCFGRLEFTLNYFPMSSLADKIVKLAYLDIWDP